MKRKTSVGSTAYRSQTNTENHQSNGPKSRIFTNRSKAASTFNGMFQFKKSQTSSQMKKLVPLRHQGKLGNASAYNLNESQSYEQVAKIVSEAHLEGAVLASN